MSQELDFLGYSFNDSGILVNKDNKKFVFTTQKEYEILGEAITEYIYEILEKKFNLQKLYFDEDNTEESSFIYASQNYNDCSEIVIFINGSGVVRAGQWARSIIINENIHMGTQFEYYEKLSSNNRGIVVFNTNDNISKKGSTKKNSKDAIEHALFAYKKFIIPHKFSKIVIIAHSYGGTVTQNLLEIFDNLNSNIKCVVLTDASFNTKKVVEKKLKNVPPIINYIISNKKLGEIIKKDGCIVYASAGTEKHERTSGVCVEAAINYINSYLNN
uniref:UPF0528 protein (inferred by orthology to a C. elegans protein) n=1 Tax=Strongyloides venezuelensis TaxID=75913 RepID=A0A0K0F7I3_STRVS